MADEVCDVSAGGEEGMILGTLLARGGKVALLAIAAYAILSILT